MKNKILSSKRGGSIPIFILVVGVISICIFTLISFFLSSPPKRLAGTDAFEEIYSELEKFNFYVETDTRDVSYLEKAKSAVDKVNSAAERANLVKANLVIQEEFGEEYLLIKKEAYSCSIAVTYKISLKELESSERI